MKYQQWQYVFPEDKTLSKEASQERYDQARKTLNNILDSNKVPNYKSIPDNFLGINTDASGHLFTIMQRALIYNHSRDPDDHQPGVVGFQVLGDNADYVARTGTFLATEYKRQTGLELSSTSLIRLLPLY